MKYGRIALLGFLVVGGYVVVGCGDDGADTNDDGAINTDAGSDAAADASSDTALTADAETETGDGSPCPDGQELVGDTCATPTDSGSPFLCTIPPFVPCGGDLVGTWEHVDSCESSPHVNPFETSCGADEDPIYFHYSDYSGTISFDGSGSYSDRYVPTLVSSSDMPKSCGGYGDCDRLGTSWGLGTCEEVEGRCICSRTGPVGESESDNRAYTVDGNEVTFFGDSVGSPYCVDGDTLYLNRVSADSYEPLLLRRQ